MKVNKWLFVAASLSAILFYSPQPMALCAISGGGDFELHIPSSGITIDKDAPIGAVLTTLRSTGNGTYFFLECPDATNTHWISLSGFSDYYGGGIYGSNIPGIGLSFRYKGNTLPYPTNIEEDAYKFIWEDVEIDLIKTGDISSGGLVFPPNMALMFGAAQNDPSGKLCSFSRDATVSLGTSPSCSVANTVSNVDLGNISLSDLTKTGRSSEKHFKIDLNCSGGTEGMLNNIYITLTDQNNIAGGTTQLSLSPSSTATGVVLELHNRFGLVTLGSDSDAPNNPGQWLDGSSGNGVYSIPLSVNYLQVAPNPTAGKINAAATYTLSYQ